MAVAADRKDRRRGRVQRRESAEGRVKRPRLDRFYRHEAGDITPGEFEFTLDLLRRPRLVLDKHVTRFEWRDDSSVLTGTMTLRRPEPDQPRSLPFAHGWPVRCRVRPAAGGKWRELWRMRTGIPSVTVEEGQLEIELHDDLDPLRRNRRKWRYRRTKRRRRGWRCDEVARDVARRDGIRLGRIAKGTKRFRKIEIEGSTLDVLREAYGKESEESGRRFVIRMVRGRLNILPYRRNPILYVFGRQLQGAVVDKTGKKPITVLEGKGRIGKGEDAKKITYTEVREKLVRRFGYVHREKNFGRVSSHAELKRLVRREMARSVRLKPRATFTTAGVPFIRRGDGAYLHLRREGFGGIDEQSANRAFVYCAGAVHVVDGEAGYTTDWEFRVDDPYLKDRLRREREARQERRSERERRKD
jgi:hypothetical protein